MTAARRSGDDGGMPIAARKANGKAQRTYRGRGTQETKGARDEGRETRDAECKGRRARGTKSERRGARGARHGARKAPATRLMGEKRGMATRDEKRGAAVAGEGVAIAGKDDHRGQKGCHRG